MKATADDALRMLEALPRDIEIPRDIDGELFFDHVTYTLPGGWRINVFIDCHDWDYIDHIIAPDGSVLDPDNCPKLDPDAIWHPVFFWSPEADDRRWGLWEDPRSTSAQSANMPSPRPHCPFCTTEFKCPGHP